MDSLLVMFEACTDSPAYMRLDSEQEAAAAVLSIMGDNPELEELVNAHTYTANRRGSSTAGPGRRLQRGSAWPFGNCLCW